MKSFLSIALFVMIALVSAVMIGFGTDLSMAKLGYDEVQEGLSERIIIKFSHVVAENTPKGLTVERFAQLVKDKTHGRVEVQVFPNSVLHSEKTEISALQNGEVQMIAPAFSHLSSMIPAWAVLELPYLFRTQEDVENVFNGEIGQMLFSTLEQSDMKGLAFWSSGFKQMTANRPLITPDDFVGQRFRIIPSAVLEAQFRSFHAIPIGSYFGDLYSMLASGKVDGEENTISNVYTKRLYQVQKYMTISDHGFLGYAVVINQSFWNKLPGYSASDHRGDAGSDRVQQSTGCFHEREPTAHAPGAENIQIHVQTEEERAAWIQAVQPVYDKFADSIGADLMEKIRELHQRR